MTDYPDWSDGGGYGYGYGNGQAAGGYGGHGGAYGGGHGGGHVAPPRGAPRGAPRGGRGGGRGGGAPKPVSWLLSDAGGNGFNNRQQNDWAPQGGGGGQWDYGYGSSPAAPAARGRPAAPKRRSTTVQQVAAGEVSFDTSAKDPASVRSRIFVGSLAGAAGAVTREAVIEKCQPFGALKGVTFFKKQGYAFVQYSSALEADLACRKLNGTRWFGCTIDAHPVDKSVVLPPAPPVDHRPMKAVPTTNYDEISYDTSSKDPSLLRARVFIGSLGRGDNVTRNEVIELCSPYGKITAVTLFKMQGFAFVQFESPVDAVLACDKLNNKNWKGNQIDVHLAMEGGARKRGTDDELAELSTLEAKRAREEEKPKAEFEMICGVCHFACSDLAEFKAHREEGKECKLQQSTGEPPVLSCVTCETALPNAWRMLFHHMDDHHHRLKLVTVDNSEAVLATAREKDEQGYEDFWESVEKWLEELPKEEEEAEVKDEAQEVADVTIVCTTCKLVSNNWAAYQSHKKLDCIKPRDPMEPACIKCSMCEEPFVSSWKATIHLMQFHRMKLFTPDYTKEAFEKAHSSSSREDAIVDRRMKVWIESQLAASAAAAPAAIPTPVPAPAAPAS